MFSAGVAVRDITPSPGAPLWGYADRASNATGTLDPLFAKCVAFANEDDVAALVTMDLGRVPLEPVCDRIRRRARDKGVQYVFLAATHTHHAPVMEAPGAPYIETIEEQIGTCIEDAVDFMRPVAIGVGRCTIDVAHNRRRVLDDGRCLMLWRNEKRVPTSPRDLEADLIRIDATDGQPMALLVHYACHPVVMGPENCRYSADYPGEMARLVKESTGAECLFLQGACGDINPYLDKTRSDADAVEAMRSVGKTCADSVLGVYPSIQAVEPRSPAVAFSEKAVEVGLRWNLDDAEQLELLRKAAGPMFETYISGLEQELKVPLSVLVLNRDLAFVGMPGEIFVYYQIALKQVSPLKNTFLCGYTGGYHAYFPTVRDAAAGGYGGATPTYVGLGAGDKLLTEAALETGRLSGRLKQKYSSDDFAILDA